MTDWIKRSDRMPEREQRLLVYRRNGSRDIDIYPFDYDWTHWMPLPEPPKRTVMVELDDETVRAYADSANEYYPSSPKADVIRACRKALKEMDR